MALGKFVAIMVGNRAPPPAAPAPQWQHRQLDQIKPVDHEVEQADFIGVHDVLRIVQ